MAFEFARCEDPEVIRLIVTEVSIYPLVSDDNAPPREECRPPLHPDLLYLMCYDGNEPIGLWLFVPENSISMEVHTYMVPKYIQRHGQAFAHWDFAKNRRAAKECIEYLWANTEVQRIWTKVPAFNAAARKFAKAAGMQQFGVNPQSFLKHGQLWDVSFLGISRPSR